MLKGNLRKDFDRFPWQNNTKQLNAWKSGIQAWSKQGTSRLVAEHPMMMLSMYDNVPHIGLA